MKKSVRPFIDDSLVEKVCKRKYYKDGEDWQKLVLRVASYVASVEEDPEQRQFWTQEFFTLINKKIFLPGGRILANAGTKIQNLANCYVAKVGDSRKEIYDMLKDVAEIHAQGGGIGLNFSELREEGALINSTGGEASGPVSFMDVFNLSADVIRQASRRGAMLAALRADHPDIFKFITAKLEEDKLNNFNISVLITDALMEAFENDESIELKTDHTTQPKKVKAADILTAIAEAAWKSGEPGFLFIDTMNKHNPNPHSGDIIGVNPCVTGDTLILTDAGPRFIKDVVGKETLIHDGESYSSNDGVVLTKKRAEVLKVKLSNGLALKVTPDHEFILGKDSIKVKAEDLNVGDMVKVNSEEGSFGPRGSYEEGAIYGLVAGDGTILDTKFRLYIYGDNVNKYGNKVEEIFGKPLTYNDARAVMYSTISEYPFVKHSEFNPEFWNFSKDFLRGYLSGLIAADGSLWISDKSRISIALSSNQYQFLEDIQKVLLLFGIHSSILDERGEELKDFNDGYGEYKCQATYRLLIYGKDVQLYNDRVGFFRDDRKERYTKYTKSHRFYSQKQFFEVHEISKAGIEDVYDVVNTATHAFYANFMLVSNCGEIPGVDGASCILGSLNLKKFLIETEAGYTLDYGALAIAATIAIKFLDNVVSLTHTGVEFFDETNVWDRKVGLGVMGWADVLAYMRIPYDSEEAREYATSTAKVIYNSALAVSEKLGEELGFYPGFDENHSVNPLTLEKCNPRRNSNMLSIAPTGTISLISEVNHSIEPFFMLAYQKNFKFGGKKTERSSIVVSKTFKEIILKEFEEDTAWEILAETAKSGKFSESSKFSDETNSRICELRKGFRTSHEIKPIDHVLMQAAWQRGVDQSISKTINLPHSATVEDVLEVIYVSWKSGLKGLTVYRDGSRQEQIMEKPSKK